MKSRMKARKISVAVAYPIVVALLPFTWRLMAPAIRTGEHGHNYYVAFSPIVTVILLMLIYILLKKRRLYIGPLFWPLCAYIGAQIFSLLAARSILNSLRFIAAWLFLLIAYVVIYNCIDSLAKGKQFMHLYMLGILALGLYGTYIAMFLHPRIPGINPFWLGDVQVLETNDMALLLEQVLFFPICSLLWQKRRNKHMFQLVGLSVSAGILIALLAATLSRGAYVATFVALLFLTVFATRIRRLLLSLSIIIVSTIIGVAVIQTFGVNVHQEIATIFEPNRTSARIYRAIGGLKAFHDHLFIGVGVDNFQKYYYWDYISPDAFQYLGNLNLGIGNLYIRVLCETGILGGLTFAWLLMSGFRLMLRAVKVSRKGDSAVLTTAIFAGSVANFVHYMFFDVVHPLPWLFLFAGLAIAHSAIREARSTKPLRAPRKEAPEVLRIEAAGRGGSKGGGAR